MDDRLSMPGNFCSVWDTTGDVRKEVVKICKRHIIQYMLGAGFSRSVYTNDKNSLFLSNFESLVPDMRLSRTRSGAKTVGRPYVG